ncbi:hypothetical protein OAU50_06355 [Planctomycetota bacterium]|nr:hypothetical protein [Planctomycetota bacterium]
MLIGHDIRRWAARPYSPVRKDGVFVPHTNKPLSEMEQVYDDFAGDCSVLYTPLPDSVSWFIISPALNVLNPHRELVEIPEDTVLVPETDFMGHKSGGDKEVYLKLFKQAQKALGTHLTLEEYENDADTPETIWQPTPQDEKLWKKARASMIDMAHRLKQFYRQNEAYPTDLEDLRPYYSYNQMPKDPFLADYFEYNVTEAGFTIHCYGKDWRKDDSDEIPYKDIYIDQSFDE